ncbi:MAG: SCO family protein [Actinobacteria bacterium]|nr:SCO family protein [Actinomycetota bacterium]
MTGVPRQPRFDLVDHDGRRVSEGDYRGSHVILFFGFTNCAMVCPRALARLTDVLDRLGPAADRIRPLYVTVDPERDTPAVMKEYLARTAPRFTGLTGTPEQIAAVRSAFRVFARRVEDPDAPDGYTMPHTAITYVLGPDGRFLTHVGDAVPAAEVAQRIRELLEASPTGAPAGQ